MPYSMTGFGKAEYNDESLTLTVEMKSVNSRYCDLYLKMPRVLNPLEDKLRKLITGQIARGKVEVFINYVNMSEDSKEVAVDIPLANAYKKALKAMVEDLELREDFGAFSIAKMPEVLSVKNADEDMDKLWELLEETALKAIEAFKQMRLVEGEKMKEDLLNRGEVIKEKTKLIAKYAPKVVEQYREKLHNRISELLEKPIVDEDRLATEVAIFADKCAIDEELVRLDSHMVQMESILNEEGPVGRKLDFLVQEMNREINTIGSKANYIDITNVVLDVKSEIEKIREQVQNIE